MTKNTSSGRANHLRRALVSTVATLTIAGIGWQVIVDENVKADEPEPMFMFVQVSEGLEVDNAENTLRLVKVSQQTLYFSDRPNRIAGHLKMTDYLNEWTQGEDNFGENPPNATLSVYEPGQPDNTLAVVELTNPVVDGADMVDNFTLLDGKIPDSGEATALFIDRIGIGGGVGPGYHGVGVGARGPGVL